MGRRVQPSADRRDHRAKRGECEDFGTPCAHAAKKPRQREELDERDIAAGGSCEKRPVGNAPWRFADSARSFAGRISHGVAAFI